MEGAEMQRHVWPQVLDEPRAQARHLLGSVVMARDEQTGHFEPDRGLVADVAQRIEHRRQFGQADLPVEVFVKGLEIDVRGVHGGEERLTGRGTDIAGRYHHGA
jgi:hypothetical protein